MGTRKIDIKKNSLILNTLNSIEGGDSQTLSNSLSVTQPTSSSKITNTSAIPGNINVVCRFRPLNEKEKNLAKEHCVDFSSEQELSIKSPQENNSVYKFAFDRIFDTNCTQQEVYEYAAKPIVNSVLEGFNGTIFAYGQTSSGKTHTMQGVLDSPEKEGIIPRMVRYVFTYILHASDDLEFTVKVSMVEIYMEKIRDLIDPTRSNLSIREDRAKGIYIEDLSEHYADNDLEVLALMKEGSDNRASAVTNMNEHSSRSHSIFVMTIHQNNRKDNSAKTGKLYLVDLAGSEKISKTGATGSTLDEAKMINKSLTTLGMVIYNLTDGKSSYIPYRDSKLTRVLSESLGGNAKTTLIITCSPSSYNESETLSTLRFGLRAKKIKNKPKINKETTVAELKMEIDKLEKFLVICNKRITQLESFIGRNGLSPPNEGDLDLGGKSEKASKGEDYTNNTTNITTNITTTQSPRQGENCLTIRNEVDSSKCLNVGEESLSEENRYSECFNNEQPDDHSPNHQEIHHINNKLEEAVTKVKEYSLTLEEKQIMIDDLEDSNKNYRLQVDELVAKIESLRDRLQRLTNSKIEEREMNQELTNRSRSPNIITLAEEGEIKINADFLLMSPRVQWDVLCRIQEVVRGEGTNNEISRNENFEIAKTEVISPSGNGQTISEESLKKEKRKYEAEKKLILKALEEKSEKTNSVENENKELREKLKFLESKMSPDDKNQFKRITSLEKTLEKVNSLYHDVVTAKSVLKIENQVLEKKIKKRNERILMMEKENNDLKEQVKMRDDKLSYYGKSVLKNNLAPSHVVKVIKGGQAKQSVLSNENISEMLNSYAQNPNGD